MKLLRLAYLVALSCLAYSMPAATQEITSLLLQKPSSTLIAGGAPELLKAQAVWSDSKEYPYTGVLEWSVTDPEILDVDKNTGLATPKGPGSVKVRASLPDSSVSSNVVEITVQPTPALVDFTIEGNPVQTVTVGDSLNLTAIGRYGTAPKVYR